MSIVSCRRIVAESSPADMLECQHDMVFGNASGLEVVRDASLCAVMLNPHLAIDDVDMDQRCMNAFVLVPSHGHEEIVVLRAIEHRIEVDFTIGYRDTGLLGQEMFDQISPCNGGIHWMILSHASGILALKQGTVEHVLPHGLLERIDIRCRSKRLDLHGNAQRPFLRREQSFSAQIDIEIAST